MTNSQFTSFELPKALLASLEQASFENPTPVQQQAIPQILAGNDVLVSSQTGTGKTGAFSIPIISQLINNPDSSALIITPTRELAMQVVKAFEDLTPRKSKINSVLIIGGDSMRKQLDKLRQKPRIIIGTPGRLNDHLEKRTLKLDKIQFLVLDETDRMLDMGFSIQIDQIIKYLPDNRQTLLFSATLPDNIIKMSQKYMQNPERISIGASHNPVEKIVQKVLNLKEDQKYPELLSQLDQREGSIIIFMRTKHSADKMATQLREEQHQAQAVHGDLRQEKRQRLIKNFRNQKYRILVATDIASRGLDIPHIKHVINYHLPECPEDYIHRIGRTARAGQEGESLSLVSPNEKNKWIAIHNLMNPTDKKPNIKGRRSTKRPAKGSFRKPANPANKRRKFKS